MTSFRLSQSASADIRDILEESQERHGTSGRLRYEELIFTAIAHASERHDEVGFRHRPELGESVISWHIANSVRRSKAPRVKSPRHVLYCRWEAETLGVGRVLHDKMDPVLHISPDMDWS